MAETTAQKTYPWGTALGETSYDASEVTAANSFLFFSSFSRRFLSFSLAKSVRFDIFLAVTSRLTSNNLFTPFFSLG